MGKSQLVGMAGLVRGAQRRAITMAVRVFVLLLVVDLALAALPHPVCKVTGVDDFDFKPLQKGEEDKPYYAVSPNGHFHYYFNFCGHAAGCYQQPACQVKIRPTVREMQRKTSPLSPRLASCTGWSGRNLTRKTLSMSTQRWCVQSCIPKQRPISTRPA